MAFTKIEWANRVWNPITGCTPISEGCENCYAKRMANRLKGRYGYPEDNPFKVTVHEDKLGEPLRWKKPSRVFVGSMSDLFHEDVEDGIRCTLFDIMATAEQHTFIILTKRVDKMKEFFDRSIHGVLPNVWLGVSVENQQRADERIPILLQIPAAIRFISVEPILEQVDISYFLPKTPYKDCPVELLPYYNSHLSLKWIIGGGETGIKARPAQQEWILNLYEQAKLANIPFFFKKWGTGTEIRADERYKAVEECRQFPSMGWSSDI